MKFGGESAKNAQLTLRLPRMPMNQSASLVGTTGSGTKSLFFCMMNVQR